jgi:hypothetical protein
MKKLLFAYLLAIAGFAVSCGGSEDHGNPPASDTSIIPQDFDTSVSGKDSLMLPH